MTTAAVVFMLAACAPAGSGRQDDSDKGEQPGCGKCTAETKALGEQISKIEGVTDLARIQYSPRVSVRLNPTLSLDAYIAAGSLEQVRPAIVKAAWDSPITPLTEITLNFKTPDNKLTELNFRFLEGTKEYTAYRDAWGPRPVK